MKKILLILLFFAVNFTFAQADCEDAIPICSDADIAMTPSGTGDVEEGDVGCLSGENNSLWFMFSVQTAGTLTFVITPAQNVDYDWALYGPNHNCADVNAMPIRCSYDAPPSYATGLNMTSTDLSEDSGGDGFVRYLDVLPGQTYYLLVDNFSPTISQFSLTFGGTASLATPFDYNGSQHFQQHPFVQPGPNADGEIELCENPTLFDFSTLTSQIINGNNNFIVKYYETNADLIDDNNAITTSVVTAPSTYYYAIYYLDPNQPNSFLNKCREMGEIKFFDISIEANSAAVTTCNNNNEGTGVFDLTTVATQMYDDPAVPVTRKFYPTMADLNNGTNEITAPWAYTSAAPGIVYVKFTTQKNCTTVGEIALSFLPVVVTQDAELSECFIAAQPTTATFNLEEAVVTNDPGATTKFYPSLQDAINDTNAIPNPLTYISSNSVVYARVTNNQGCWGTAKITLNVIPPTYSLVLKDKIICVEDRTTLDAGPGFDAYEWSSGETTSTISGVQVGSYWVDLHKNGCITRQEVKVLAAPAPVITSIDITNNTVTVNAGGGTVPYQYSMDNVVWQTSNVFDNVPRGKATVYIKDAYDCDPIPIDITVPNLVNVITPNGDDINDAIDYSVLAYTKDLQFTVYDRYGAKVFVADKKNNFRWNGYTSGKKAPTGTYWYTITWLDPVRNIPVKYSGWVMLKNIE